MPPTGPKPPRPGFPEPRGHHPSLVPGQPGTVTICCRWCGEVETWSEREVEQRHVWCRRALRQGIACPQCGELLDGQRPPAQHHGHDDDAPTPEPSTRRLALLPSF